MTETELLAEFRMAVSVAIQPGALTTGGLLWVKHQVELAAARAADHLVIANAIAARTLATAFITAALGQPCFAPDLGPLTPEQMQANLDIARFALWPFVSL